MCHNHRVARLTRRGLIVGGAPLLGAGAALLHSQVPHSHPWEAHAAEPHAGHGSHTATRGTRASAGVVDHAANGFDPRELVRDFDWGTHAAGGRARDPRVGAGRAGPRDRGRARRALRGLDLQRPHPRPDAALPRGRAAADHVRQRLRPSRTRSTSTASTRPRWTACPGIGDGTIAPGGAHRLRVRRPAGRAAPLPLPRPPAGRAHRQGPVRRVHRRPAPTRARRPTSS